jgi:outer membrane protein assembly factor BamB
MQPFFRVKRVLTLIALVIIAASTLTLLPRHQAARAASGNWPTYMGTNGRTSFNGAETTINPASAPHLKLHWKHKAAGRVTTQPIAANGLVCWGSWDGVEHATNPATGVDAWTANLGRGAATCSHTPNGVLSSAAVASVPINGVTTPVVVVGGGDAAVYKGSVYMGVASHDDCPLIQGQVVQLNAATGGLQHTFNVVPGGCTGGSV